MFRRRRKTIDQAIANQSRGLKAKRQGDSWEHLLMIEAVRQGWCAMKIPEGCKTVSRHKTIRVKSPFDFVLAKAGTAVFIDAKSTQSSAFGHASINHRQVQILENFRREGFFAGYLVHFRTQGEIAFFSTHKLLELKPGQSLKPTDGEPFFSDEKLELDFFLANAPR